ncbi:MAG: hypothetical protein ACREJQ_03275, partial [bacterium]
MEMRYLSVVVGLCATFLVTLLVIPLAVRVSEKNQWYQKIRVDGPTSHLEKDKTPTSTGWVFLIPLAVLFALFSPLRPSRNQIDSMLLLMLGISAIVAAYLGLADDMLKLKAGTSGLKARWRFIAQILIGLLIGALLLSFGMGEVYMPFTGGFKNLGLWILPLSLLTYSGTINGVNFIDGQDGLAAGCLAVTFATLAIILDTGWDDRSWGLAAGCWFMAAACLAFLWYNAYPAQVFMGEVGSTTLGAVLATIAILTGTE